MGPSLAFFLSVSSVCCMVMVVSSHRKQEAIIRRRSERAVIWAEIAHLLNEFVSGNAEWVERVDDRQRHALERLEEFYCKATGHWAGE